MCIGTHILAIECVALQGSKNSSLEEHVGNASLNNYFVPA